MTPEIFLLVKSRLYSDGYVEKQVQSKKGKRDAIFIASRF